MNVLKTPLVLSLLVVGSALAQQAAPPDERATRLDHAQRLHDQAAAIRSEADRAHASAVTECWKKFLVNACLQEADKAQREQQVKAREIDKEAREIEREVKRQDVAEHEARRVAEAPERAAAAAARAEKNRREAEAAQDEVRRKQAEAAAREAR